jgi:tripartite-type tricarboxylate transporter receptor subunit TctC
VLAVARPERWPRLPDALTTKEAGFPDVEVLFWIGISGPPGLPADIVATWDTALKEGLADKAVQDKMLNAGLVASYMDAKAMVARVERDRKTTQSLYGHWGTKLPAPPAPQFFLRRTSSSGADQG